MGIAVKSWAHIRSQNLKCSRVSNKCSFTACETLSKENGQVKQGEHRNTIKVWKCGKLGKGGKRRRNLGTEGLMFFCLRGSLFGFLTRTFALKTKLLLLKVMRTLRISGKGVCEKRGEVFAFTWKLWFHIKSFFFPYSSVCRPCTATFSYISWTMIENFLLHC